MKFNKGTAQPNAPETKVEMHTETVIQEIVREVPVDRIVEVPGKDVIIDRIIEKEIPVMPDMAKYDEMLAELSQDIDGLHELILNHRDSNVARIVDLIAGVDRLKIRGDRIDSQIEHLSTKNDATIKEQFQFLNSRMASRIAKQDKIIKIGFTILTIIAVAGLLL